LIINENLACVSAAARRGTRSPLQADLEFDGAVDFGGNFCRKEIKIWIAHLIHCKVPSVEWHITK